MSGVNSGNKLIYEVLRQREQLTVDRKGRKISQHTRRLGLINKLELALSPKQRNSTPSTRQTRTVHRRHAV